MASSSLPEHRHEAGGLGLAAGSCGRREDDWLCARVCEMRGLSYLLLPS